MKNSLPPIHPKHLLRRKLREQYTEIKNTSLPKPFYWAFHNVDIDVLQYEAYIQLEIAACLDDEGKISPEKLNLGLDLKARMVECEKQLQAMRSYIEMLLNGATILKEYLETPEPPEED